MSGKYQQDYFAVPRRRTGARSGRGGLSATYDLVIDPTNLWLAIHESIGHATELDRAMSYEASFAGTSFATFDQLGSLRYGSDAMNVTADRTTPHGLATIGYDDEGVQTGCFDIVHEGILVGYQMDRQIAAEQGLGRSNGCAFGSSALQTPLQRMANVSLAPAPSDGPSVDDLISGSNGGSTSLAMGAGPLTCSERTFSSQASATSRSRKDGWRARSKMWSIRVRQQCSGHQWRLSVAGLLIASKVVSAAAKANPDSLPR